MDDKPKHYKLRCTEGKAGKGAKNYAKNDEYYKKLWLLGLNIFDDKDGKAQRICVPFKTEPDMARIREQLENYPASVFLTPVMEANDA